MDPPALHLSPDEPPKPRIRTSPFRYVIYCVFFAIVIVIVAFVSLGRSLWVGRTSLTVEFVVVDDDSGSGIPGAVIDITEDLMNGKRDFQLYTSPNGRAYSNPTNVMSTGEDGLFTHTSIAYRLDWVFQVSAEGYEPTAKCFLPPRPQKETSRRSHLLSVTVPMKRK